MGEKAHHPQENGVPRPPGASSDDDMPSDPEEAADDDLDDISPEEFQMLDSQLDALNSALDDIEQKNDDIHAQLLVLLQSNREIRKQMQESNSTPEESSSQKQ
ncbi:hypothetical protein Zmor_016834 [Zophobas morio]|uniref:Uncharacterized protein n=2 Tax=Zophobas morio TaxID=2755281 RepID=A0AA38MBZ6_9CUCU|nr:hypothetical protein Zmor_016834 [Zophobas morio]